MNKMKTFNIILRSLLFIFLTALTQIGGLVYLLTLPFYKFLHKKFAKKFVREGLKFGLFIALYSLASFLIVPLIARPLGREPLPLTTTTHVRPLNIITCLLNRHYVHRELKRATMDVGRLMNIKFPGTVINYLDANFPFFDGFPLVPHLSHNDGKKLDIAFCYIDSKTGNATNETPSFIGYGVNEEPAANEVNMPGMCAEKGNWQYNFIASIVPQGDKANFKFDSRRTRYLVSLFAESPSIQKIFIEPHLKTRLKLTSDKVRFHGCHAVRHDDHVHIQLPG
jgi:hypothetical protein